MTCMARAGFLTIHDCGEPAATACATCGRTVCPKHLSPASGFTKCLDCAALDQEPAEEDQLGEETEYGPDWAHRYRREYYTSSDYTPHDSTRSYYSDSDVRSFDETAQGESEDEAGEGGAVES